MMTRANKIKKKMIQGKGGKFGGGRGRCWVGTILPDYGHHPAANYVILQRQGRRDTYERDRLTRTLS